jgi:hypothetical protein
MISTRLASVVAVLVFTFTLITASISSSQESSSRPENTAPSKPAAPLANTQTDAPAPDAPSTALRDLLVAACAHDEPSFEKILTARNAEAFSRLAPAARIELMKRFVLLDGVGKPAISANPSGRPEIRCTTADGAADIQLGGTELHDNIALLPLDIRDASDLHAGDPRHILMGMVREKALWKVLSLGMLFLDLPSLEVEWDQASIGANEKAALADLKNIAAAIENYRKTYTRLPESLGKLGHATKRSAEAAGLLPSDLVSGQSNGYTYRMVIVGANEIGAPAQYEVSATPVKYGRTGNLSYFLDAKGKLHAADHQGGVGHSVDPVVE